MNFSKKLVLAAIGGLLLTAASAWAGPTTAQTPAAVAVSGEQSMLGFLKPLMTDADIRARQKDCRPDTLYSSHDVVGDSEACFRTKIDVRNGAASPAFSGIL